MPTPKRQVSPHTGKVSWRVQFRNSQRRITSRTFPTKPLANAFIRDMDRDKKRALSSSEAAGVTFGDALGRYQRYELTRLPEHKWERDACSRLQTYDIAGVMLDDLSLRDAQKHVMFRERSVGPASIIREFTLMRTVLKRCSKWYGLEYPWKGLELPQPSPPRDRLITDEEEALMAMAAGIDIDDPDTPLETASQCAVAGFLFACDTALRLGEVAGLTFGMVDLENNLLHLPDGLCKKGKGKTKGKGRSAIITARARKILAKLSHRAGSRKTKVFGMDSGSMGTLFRRVRAKAFPKGYEHFTFHDSRHLAITRLARTGIPVVALARIVGHRDLNMLMVYYEEPAENIAKAVNEGQSLSENAAVSKLGAELRSMVASGKMTPEELVAELLSKV